MIKKNSKNLKVFERETKMKRIGTFFLFPVYNLKFEI
jgi:hypothetical protein